MLDVGNVSLTLSLEKTRLSLESYQELISVDPVAKLACNIS